VRERIAIVGSGVSGLGCLRFLRAHHDVTVFDRDLRPGGHAHTIDVTEPGTGRALPMDTGFMVFNEVTYPHLCRLFKELGVKPKKTSMSFAVRHDPSGLEWCGSSRTISSRSVATCSARASGASVPDQQVQPTWPGPSGAPPRPRRRRLRDWCARKGLGQDFLDLDLVPDVGRRVVDSRGEDARASPPPR
jgi:uncharacterized protein with NAD-binding domain and iron-sulfur cluster